MPIDLGKKSGAISLAKNERVTIDNNGKITATVEFSSATDYDVYAVVRAKDGSERVCSTFGSDAQPNPTDVVGGIRHLGDVTRGGSSDIATETLEIVMEDWVDQIAIVAYSAQSNGTGSFRRYQVTTSVDNGAGTTVTVAADQANDNDNVYTVVPAIIHNRSDGVAIERVEMYSKPGSELRPTYLVPGTPVKKGLFGKAQPAAPVPGNGSLAMDAGSKNKYK